MLINNDDYLSKIRPLQSFTYLCCSAVGAVPLGTLCGIPTYPGGGGRMYSEVGSKIPVLSLHSLGNGKGHTTKNNFCWRGHLEVILSIPYTKQDQLKSSIQFLRALWSYSLNVSKDVDSTALDNLFHSITILLENVFFSSLELDVVLLQLVPTVLCPFTIHLWAKVVFIFSITSPSRVKDKHSSFSLVFFRLKSISPLTSYACLSVLATLLNETASTSFLCGELRTGHRTPCVVSPGLS